MSKLEWEFERSIGTLLVLALCTLGFGMVLFAQDALQMACGLLLLLSVGIAAGGDVVVQKTTRSSPPMGNEYTSRPGMMLHVPPRHI